MTQNEFTRRMAEIDARPVETMTPEEEASLAAAEAMDDGTSCLLYTSVYLSGAPSVLSSVPP